MSIKADGENTGGDAFRREVAGREKTVAGCPEEKATAD